MSFSAWLLPCFFEGGGTSKNANADEENGGAEKTTCRKERKNVLCSWFQRVVSAVSTCCPFSSSIRDKKRGQHNGQPLLSSYL